MLPGRPLGHIERARERPSERRRGDVRQIVERSISREQIRQPAEQQFLGSLRLLLVQKHRYVVTVLGVGAPVLAIRLSIAQRRIEQLLSLGRIALSECVAHAGQRAVQVPSPEILDFRAGTARGLTRRIIPKHPEGLRNGLRLDERQYAVLELGIPRGAKTGIVKSATIMDVFAIKGADPGEITSFKINQRLTITLAIVGHDVAQPLAALVDVGHKAVGLYPIERGIGVEFPSKNLKRRRYNAFVDAEKAQVLAAGQRNATVPRTLNRFPCGRPRI